MMTKPLFSFQVARGDLRVLCTNIITSVLREAFHSWVLYFSLFLFPFFCKGLWHSQLMDFVHLVMKPNCWPLGPTQLCRGLFPWEMCWSDAKVQLQPQAGQARRLLGCGARSQAASSVLYRMDRTDLNPALLLVSGAVTAKICKALGMFICSRINFIFSYIIET